MKSCSATFISSFCAIRNRTTFGSKDATGVMHLLGEEDKCAASALIILPRPVRVVRRSGDVFWPRRRKVTENYCDQLKKIARVMCETDKRSERRAASKPTSCVLFGVDDNRQSRYSLNQDREKSIWNKRHTRRVAWGEWLAVFKVLRLPSACIFYVEVARAFGHSHSPPRGVPCSLFLQRSPTSPTQRDVGRRVALNVSHSHSRALSCALFYHHTRRLFAFLSRKFCRT